MPDETDLERITMIEMPQDENFLIRSFQHAGIGTAVENLGITLQSVDQDRIVLKMPITEKARQPYGLLHGGVSMVLAETAASFHASWGLDLSKEYPVGIEINGSHVRSATEGVVRAEGRVVRRTRSIVVHQVDIILEETNQLLSTARVTNFIKKLEVNAT